MSDEGLNNVREIGWSLQREPLGRQIATALARQILSGRLAAGTVLTQEELSTWFSCSRMPVRDALKELIWAGYVVESSNQFSVAHFEREDVEDTLALQASTSGLLARRATERATDEELDELFALHERMLAAASRRNGELMAQLNRSFHQTTYRLARSQRLVAFHRAATLHIAWRFYQDHPEMADTCNEQHAAILDAMRARNGPLVERLTIEHTALSQTPFRDGTAPSPVGLEHVGEARPIPDEA